MTYENKRPDVAVFIDFENVYVSVRDKLDANPNFEAIMDRCGDLGRVIIARAYADWYRYPRVTSALYANGIEPMYVPTYYYDKEMGRTGRAIKNSVDMNLCIDAMKSLFTNTNVDRFVLVTGDRDFIPLVNSIRQQGKEVYVIGIGGAASTHLAQSADEFFFYEQLVGKSPSPQAEPPRSRQSSRSSTPAAAPAATPPPAAQPQQPQPNDVHKVLVDAVHLVRKRGYVSTLGSLKLVMKELMGGDFKENRYKDLSGRAFAKFKDFVVDAEKRGMVQIFTNGTVNEVFLPEEDPYKLSQFAAELREDSPDTVAEDVALSDEQNDDEEVEETTSPAAARTAGRRRRRRSRGQRQGSVTEQDEMADDQVAPAEVVFENGVEPVDELQALATLESSADATELDEAESVDSAPTADDTPEVEQASFEDVVAETPESAAIDVATEQPEPSEAVAEEEPVMAVVGPVVDTPLESVDEDAPEEDAPEVVEDAPETSTTARPDAVDEPEAVEVEVDFSDEEWSVFREMMGGFTKPTSFASIFDALRELRRQDALTRTNEQLRTMVKQAISKEIVERVGRGKRIYYALKQDGDGEQDTQGQEEQAQLDA